MDDSALLQQYAENQSDEAFAALVTRHVNLVYSVALRQVGNAHNAEEITQAVFIILAKKAAQLRHDRALSSWLFQATRLTANNFVRSEIRRHHREEEAFMRSVLSESENEVWPKIAPLLDTAVAGLREKDRQAIVLRFYEGRNMREVGLALGASEEAAGKRVSRALESLRKFFSKRGVMLSAAVIASAVSASSVQAAPAGLAQTISTVAATKGAAAGGSTLTLAKGALKLMAWTKAKMAAVAAVAVLLAAGTTTVVVKEVARAMSSAPSWTDDPGVWVTDSRVLDKLQPVMLIRPTQFPDKRGGLLSDGRMMRKDAPVATLLEDAYDSRETRSVVPDGMPGERYDLLFTLGNKSLLQAELAKRFGYVARRETRQTDVYLLQVKNTNPSNLKPAKDNATSGYFGSNAQAVFQNEGISELIYTIESIAGKPILDRTGLTGRYDITIHGNYQESKETLEAALRDQLGLELVPSVEPVEMLVLEKTRN